MTNTEKLSYIYGLSTLNGGFDEVAEEYCNDLLEELEIMNIIRKHKLLNYVIKNDKCAKMYGLSVEDKKCLKEWLENADL